jgi:hypothetical protein
MMMTRVLALQEKAKTEHEARLLGQRVEGTWSLE